MAVGCEICRREINPREMAYCRYCKTPYHIDCIKSWLYRNRNCPHCGRSTSLAHYRRGVPENLARDQVSQTGAAASPVKAAAQAPSSMASSPPPSPKRGRERKAHGGGKILFIINIVIIAILLASTHYAYTNYVEYGPYLFADENEKTVMPGQQAEYIVTLQNTGNIVSRYDISLDDDSVVFPVGWQITLTDFDGIVYESNSIDKSLNPSEEYQFKVKISTTSGSEANSQGSFKIIARSKDGKFASSQVFNVYTNAIYSYELHENDTQKYVSVGGTVQFSAEIENMGNDADTYYMRLEGLTSGWNASLLEQQATIESNRTGDIILIMTAPNNAQGNDLGEVVLKVSSQYDPDNIKTVKFTAIVNPSYSFDVTSSELSKEVLPGTTANFTFKLRNLGNLSDTFDLVATASLPTGWSYELSKEEVTLQEEGQVTLGLSIIVPDNSPGSFEGTVNLVITSRGSQDTDSVKFTVNTVEEQNKFILLELFTSVNCVYCPFAEKAVEDLLVNYPGKIVVIEHHINDSLQSDFSGDRYQKYVGGGYPTAVIDGTKKIAGGSSNTYTQYASAIDQRLDEDLLVKINATISDSVINPGMKTINALIKPEGLSPDTMVEVHFVTYRNGVSPASHPSKVYNYVSFEAYKSVISSLDEIESVTVTLDIPEDGGIIIIVQDSETNKVYQSIML